MGACGSSSKYESHEDDGSSGKSLSAEEMRKTRARDSMRFNNRRKGGTDNEANENAQTAASVRNTRDSMMFNNKNKNHAQLQLALMTGEDFIAGCRDVLRSPLLLEKLKEGATDGRLPFEALDLICVSMIPRNNMFKFYSQECLKHAVFATADGPSDVLPSDEYEHVVIPTGVVLKLLRNMFFFKRMITCFEQSDLQARTITKSSFAEACQQAESVYTSGDPSAVFDRVGEGQQLVDWRHLVAGIADNFINSIALPQL